MSEPVDDLQLMAFADGALSPQRAAAVEVAIAADQALAARVAALRAQNAALIEAFDPWLDEPVPSRLLDAARRRRGRSRAWLGPALATAAALVVGIAAGWYGRELSLEHRGTPTTFAREAALSHALYAADARRPVEVWAAEEKSLVNWLTKRLEHPVHAPDLTSAGYALVGGRLVAGNERPTALFMYENAHKARLTLQVRKAEPGAGGSAFRYAVENGVGVFYWIDDDVACAISGNFDRGELLAVARAVYADLSGSGAPHR